MKQATSLKTTVFNFRYLKILGTLLLVVYMVWWSRQTQPASNSELSAKEVFERVRSTAAEGRLKSLVAQMLSEKSLREQTPPTEAELEQMTSNPVLCFHNDDCREDALTLKKYCGVTVKNKYYCSQNDCPLTMADDNCAHRSSLLYATCENNVCSTSEVTTSSWSQPYKGSVEDWKER